MFSLNKCKGKFYFLFFFLAAFILSSCSTLPDYRVLKRYKEDQQYRPADAKPEIKIYHSTLAVPSPQPENFTSLKEKAQAAYISAFSEKIKDPDDFREALISPFVSKKPKADDRTRLKVKRRFVFSVEKVGFFPADRIQSLKITIILPDKTQFTSWSKLANEYKTVDLGTVTAKQQNKTSLSGSLTPPIPGMGAITASTESTKSLQEVQKNTSDDVILTGGLAEQGKKGIIWQESNIVRDISGTVYIDATIEFLSGSYGITNVVAFKELFKSGNAVASDKIIFTRPRIYYPTNAHLEGATFIYEGKIRKVTSGDSTYIEGDDEFEMIPLNGKGAITNLGGDLIFYRYFLFTREPPEDADGEWVRNILHWKESDDDENATIYNAAIYFDSFDEADKFRKWLKTAKPDLAKLGAKGFEKTLTYSSGAALDSADYEKLMVGVEDAKSGDANSEQKTNSKKN